MGGEKSTELGDVLKSVSPADVYSSSMSGSHSLGALGAQKDNLFPANLFLEGSDQH